MASAGKAMGAPKSPERLTARPRCAGHRARRAEFAIYRRLGGGLCALPPSQFGVLTALTQSGGISIDQRGMLAFNAANQAHRDYPDPHHSESLTLTAQNR